MDKLALNLGEPADYLFWLRQEDDRVREAEAQRRRIVIACRELEISWTEIGKAMRLTKQAAQQRYGS